MTECSKIKTLGNSFDPFPLCLIFFCHPERSRRIYLSSTSSWIYFRIYFYFLFSSVHAPLDRAVTFLEK